MQVERRDRADAVEASQVDDRGALAVGQVGVGVRHAAAAHEQRDLRGARVAHQRLHLGGTAGPQHRQRHLARAIDVLRQPLALGDDLDDVRRAERLAEARERVRGHARPSPPASLTAVVQARKVGVGPRPVTRRPASASSRGKSLATKAGEYGSQL